MSDWEHSQFDTLTLGRHAVPAASAPTVPTGNGTTLVAALNACPIPSRPVFAVANGMAGWTGCSTGKTDIEIASRIDGPPKPSLLTSQGATPNRSLAGRLRTPRSPLSSYRSSAPRHILRAGPRAVFNCG